MIRPATFDDIPRLLKMGRSFAEVASLHEHVGYDDESMAKTFAYMLEDVNCLLLIGEAGAIGAQKAPHPFNHSHWIAQELFWWSEGREGMRLLSALEDWAARHCHSLRMITLAAVNPDRMGQLYQRRGYAPLEHGYLRVFNDGRLSSL